MYYSILPTAFSSHPENRLPEWYKNKFRWKHSDLTYPIHPRILNKNLMIDVLRQAF